MPGMAFGMGLITVVGQCGGAADFEAAKKYTAKIMKLSWITLILISGSIFVFMEHLVGIFRLSAEAHNYAKVFLQVHCVSMAIGWPLSFALPNALRAAGDVHYVMIVATLSMFCVRVSASYFITFSLGVGPLGVWIAMGLDFLVRGSFYLGRWMRGRWQTKQII